MSYVSHSDASSLLYSQKMKLWPVLSQCPYRLQTHLQLRWHKGKSLLSSLSMQIMSALKYKLTPNVYKTLLYSYQSNPCQ